MTPNPRYIIKESPQTKRVLFKDGDTSDIIRAIMVADRESSKYINTAGLSMLRGSDDRATLQNIYDLMQGRIDYQTDKRGHEIVRSPAYLFHTGIGDCKSYSVAIGAMCRAMGIPYRYRFTGAGPRSKYTHVYIVATISDGTDIALDAIPDNLGKYVKMGTERRAGQKLDLRPGQRIPAGIQGIQGPGFWTDTVLLIGALILFFMFFAKDSK